MESALKKAIEGGWILRSLRGQMTYSMDFKTDAFGRNRLWCQDDIGTGYWLNENDAFIDPLFWRALGKALDLIECSKNHIHDVANCEDLAWLTEWHRFIDHLAEGGDAESFFKELLANQPR